MTITEIPLDSLAPKTRKKTEVPEVPLYIHGRQIATVQRLNCKGRPDCIGLRWGDDVRVELPAAVDISEQLDRPRIFVLEGEPADRFVTFGGEFAYWISTSGAVEKSLRTFRDWSCAECWVTAMIARTNDTVIIYEAGILVITQDLDVRCHKKKFFNDFFVSIEGDTLRFLQDHEEEWTMPLGEADSEAGF